MSITVHLLGRPRIELSPAASYRFRSRKSWALLAYLLLASDLRRAPLCRAALRRSRRPPAGVALEPRRDPAGLGDGARSRATRSSLRSPPAPIVDVDVLTHGSWADAVALPGLGGELLERLDSGVPPASTRGCWPSAAGWRPPPRRCCTRPPSASMSAGTLDAALDFAVRARGDEPPRREPPGPADPAATAAGDDVARRRPVRGAARRCSERELGVAPGRGRRVGDARGGAASARRRSNRASVEAILEAGAAAVSAGAVEAGVARCAPRSGWPTTALTASLRMRPGSCSRRP